jgi:hypothetical protein
MAASEDPLARAQDVKRCQLCPGKDRKSVAEIVCDTCHVDLCKDCVGHHMTSDPIIRHDVVTFEIKKSEIIRPWCNRHRDKQCVMVCDQCDSLFCVECFFSGLHDHDDTHKLSEIPGAFDSDKERLNVYHELAKLIGILFESIPSCLEDLWFYCIYLCFGCFLVLVILVVISSP